MRMDAALRSRLATNLAAFDVREADPGGLRRAAVCAVITRRGQGPAPEDFHLGERGVAAEAASVLVLRRSRRGRSHRGQLGLPGGRVDAGESDLDAAMREMAEEVGIGAADVTILGRLDDYVTRSGYHIRPFVVWAEVASPHIASPGEIAHIHHVPLAELTRADSPRWLHIPQSDRPVLQLPAGDTCIHAPTAAMLLQLVEVGLRGRATRTADVEEPVFAWR